MDSFVELVSLDACDEANHWVSYIKAIEGLNQALQDFEKKLKIDPRIKDDILKEHNANVSTSPAPGKASKHINWNYEWDKIKIAWGSKELTQSLAEMDARNDDLENLLHGGEEIKQRKQLRKARNSKPIQRLRRHANTLYSFLAKQWPCSCQPSQHNATVFLKQKAVDHKVSCRTTEMTWHISYARHSHWDNSASPWFLLFVSFNCGEQSKSTGIALISRTCIYGEEQSCQSMTGLRYRRANLSIGELHRIQSSHVIRRRASRNRARSDENKYRLHQILARAYGMCVQDPDHNYNKRISTIRYTLPRAFNQICENPRA